MTDTTLEFDESKDKVGERQLTRSINIIYSSRAEQSRAPIVCNGTEYLE